MELDFSGLNKLQFQNFKDEDEQPPEQPQKAPTERKQQAPIEIPAPEEKRPESPANALSVATAKLNIEKENQRKLNEMYGEYRQNREKASQYIPQILKGARSGISPAQLLLTACKCISAMTGEKVFYEQIEGDLKAVYGLALMDLGALDLEQEAVSERLEKLQEAQKRKDLSPDEKKRIDSAIKAHKDRLEAMGTLNIEASLNVMF